MHSVSYVWQTDGNGSRTMTTESFENGANNIASYDCL